MGICILPQLNPAFARGLSRRSVAPQPLVVEDSIAAVPND